MSASVLTPVDASPSSSSAPATGGEAPSWSGWSVSPWVYRWGVLLATVGGAALRAAHIARPFNRLMAWNEGHYAMIALNFDRYGLFVQRNELGLDHTFSPGVPWLIWAAFKAFGPSEWAARLPIVAAGVVAIPLTAAVVRRLFRSDALGMTAAAFAAVAPGLVYFAQNVQLDTPSIACALAAAALLLRYRDSQRRGDLVGAGIWAALAVWFKFTAVLCYPAYLLWWWPARPRRPGAAVATAAAFVGTTLLPSAVWVASGWIGHQVPPQFYHRMWDLQGLAKALTEIPLEVEAHLFLPVFLLVAVGLPETLHGGGSGRELGVWSVPWVAPYLTAPWDSLVNRYYDLPVTYLLTAVAAVGAWRLARWIRPRQAVRAAGCVVALALVLTTACDLWDPMTDRVARAMMPHVPPIDPVPFYSAKVVARLPRGRTVVDTPQTMFYAGGDPRWIDMTGGDVRQLIEGETYDYIVLNDYGHGQEPYYVVDGALRARLALHHYVQIAPAAWAHRRTRVADLGGYREPATPYWAPWPAWRRSGLEVWW